MGQIIIQKETTIDPISLIGREAGVCWGANIEDTRKKFLRMHEGQPHFMSILTTWEERSASIIRMRQDG